MKITRIISIVAALSLCFSTGCKANAADDDGKERTKNIGKLSGIPILTFTDGNPWKTDMGSNFGLLLGPEERFQECRIKPTVSQSLMMENGNPYLSLRFENLQAPHIFAGIWMSVFGHVDVKDVAMPREITAAVDGLGFRVRAPNGAVGFKVEVKDAGGEMLNQKYFEAGKNWEGKHLELDHTAGMKEIVFVIESRFQPGFNSAPSGTLDIDDIFLTAKDGVKPPLDGNELLNFAKDRCMRYFIWNYREAKGGTGFVLERNSFHDLVSISGMGFAFPAVVIAEKDGIISAGQSRSQTLAMLKWIEKIDCKKGGGLNGFPFHFLTPGGERAGTSEVGTIDWAICAAGIRVAMQHFSGDKEITEIGGKLLKRPDWKSVVSKGGLISHGLSVNKDGTSSLIDADWGSSFTEEAYVVALEAVASGSIDAEMFSKLRKETKNGFWPSYFGSGFTYNWLQLWTGPREPFASNSRKAYGRDADFCMKRYGKPLLGSTACETFSGSDESGFLKWDTYTGETGSDVFLAEANAVKHLSVCPYGAALALPFAREKAMTALAEFAKLSGVHPVIGLPDSIRIEALPEGFRSPISNWAQFAIDVGPMWMAIEATEKNRVAGLYLKDGSVRKALEQLDGKMK